MGYYHGYVTAVRLLANEDHTIRRRIVDSMIGQPAPAANQGRELRRQWGQAADNKDVQRAAAHH
eukprot:COSAG01_NODE_44984_length_413_cov_11.742038_1_plen_63_part_10